MEFYDVLERRRTVRDFSHKEVSDALLKKVLAAAFRAPTNDHLHQLEFIVIRDKNRIAEMIAPVAGNTEAIQQTYIAAEGHAMDEDELAMFEDALPKQQRMLMQSGCLVLPFFRQRGCPFCEPGEQSGLNYFASAWAAMENIFLAAAAEGLGCALRIPIAGESAHVKQLIGAPADYELACFLAVGWPDETVRPPFRRKEISAEDRIHEDRW